jgi:hypothetical protein
MKLSKNQHFELEAASLSIARAADRLVSDGWLIVLWRHNLSTNRHQPAVLAL